MAVIESKWVDAPEFEAKTPYEWLVSTGGHVRAWATADPATPGARLARDARTRRSSSRSTNHLPYSNWEWVTVGRFDGGDQAWLPRLRRAGREEQSEWRRAKRRLVQRLLLRGSNDFKSVDLYETWASCSERTACDLRASPRYSRSCGPSWWSGSRTGWSTIRVKHNAYPLPSRLIVSGSGAPVRRQAGREVRRQVGGPAARALKWPNHQ